MQNLMDAALEVLPAKDFISCYYDFYQKFGFEFEWDAMRLISFLFASLRLASSLGTEVNNEANKHGRK